MTGPAYRRSAVAASWLDPGLLGTSWFGSGLADTALACLHLLTHPSFATRFGCASIGDLWTSFLFSAEVMCFVSQAQGWCQS